MALFQAGARARLFGNRCFGRRSIRHARRWSSAIAAAERLEDRTLPTSYVVTIATDVVAADGQVSLREAIQAANTNAVVFDAPAGEGGHVVDNIGFAAALAGKVLLGGTELIVSGGLSISGPGANRLAIHGNDASAVFHILPGAEVSITGLRVTHGNAGTGKSGGGFFSEGTLILSQCAVTENVAGKDGGGIFANDTATTQITDSTISGNTASGTGNGGGIQNFGTLSISNSTISGNAANNTGGGLGAAGTTTLRNVTVFGNRCDADGDFVGAGGGIAAFTAATLHNTLVAGNVKGSGAGTPFDVANPLAAGSSHNLIANADGAGGLTDGTNGNIIGASLAKLIDPVLRNNGGATNTHALLSNSEAIDAGDDAQALNAAGGLLTFDQRGNNFFRRIQQARVDIGAFEASSAADIVGFINGQWWAGSSTGTAFTTALWAGVANAAYDALGEADFTGDGKADAFALLDGAWSVGTSTGTVFNFAPWGGWANANWQDVKAGDLNRDGKADILARLGGQWWGALSNADGTAFLPPTLYTTWADLPWREFFLADVTGDRRADLVGYQHGQWWVGASVGTTFVAPKLVITWADLPWQKLLLLDVEADGRADLAGFLSGEWWVSRSKGFDASASAVAPVLAVKWANVPFVDLLAGDFDGDVKDDLIGRNGGNWFVSLSTSAGSAVSFAAPKLYAQWSNLAWKDVRVADFDGDGRDDVTGRINGQWWVAESNGAGGTLATTTLWATWAELAWKAIGAVDATGTPGDGTGAGSGGAFAGGGPSSGSAASFAAGLDDEPLAVFWSRGKEDDELASGLLAA